MTLAEFNALPSAQAESVLMDCCGSARWAASVASRRPYATVETLHKSADSIWWNLERAESVSYTHLTLPTICSV